MTHKVSLNSLVLDFKRANEGKGVQAQRALTGLVAFSLAYNADMPDNGPFGSNEVSQIKLRPLMKNVVSDVNELYCVDLGTIEDLTVALFCNRYDSAWGGRRAIENFSVREIFNEALGDDVWNTINLWLERFVDAVKFYMDETRGKLS
ncbi:hypothetical protein KW817_22280 [Enterobacter quasiroggenkampii]|uniref:hypothetical protein n=1 Tax=Enterobacter quasiroggenkampii TaxID=2497436 RepID=UPI0021CE5A31|nr:hypothetical protein [Enterobacter quasiroggenkampii]MCU6405705.1 hypothetical protein [Enterobacter quasiroggenkampii]